jgi:transcriptional antiterminator
MKRLPEQERLRRGTAVLLTEQDKIDLKQIAQEQGVSQSALLRSLVSQQLQLWRAQTKRTKKSK